MSLAAEILSQRNDMINRFVEKMENSIRQKIKSGLTKTELNQKYFILPDNADDITSVELEALVQKVKPLGLHVDIIDDTITKRVPGGPPGRG
jgi:hypothetical protein